MALQTQQLYQERVYHQTDFLKILPEIYANCLAMEQNDLQKRRNKHEIAVFNGRKS